MAKRLGTKFDHWAILVGSELASLIDPLRDGRFYWQREVLLEAYRADGIPLPNLTFLVDPNLAPCRFRVMLDLETVGYGEVRRGHLLASGPADALQRLVGEPAYSSLLASVGHGLHLACQSRLARNVWEGIPLVRECWIDERERTQAEAVGCRTRDPVHDLGAQLHNAYYLSRSQRMDETMVMDLLRERARRTPDLVRSVLAHYRSSYLVPALHHLLAQGVSMEKLDLYLARLGSLLNNPIQHDPYLDRERIENDAYPLVVASLLQRCDCLGSSLRVFRLSAESELEALASIETGQGHLFTDLGDRLLISIARWQQNLEPSATPYILAVSDSLRRPLAARLGAFLDDPVSLLADGDIESLSPYSAAGFVEMVTAAELEFDDDAEPALFLDQISWRVGSHWEGRCGEFWRASLGFRQSLAEKWGVAIPDVTPEFDPMLRADELVLCLGHQELCSFGGQREENLRDLLMEFAEEQLEALLSFQSIDDLLERAQQGNPATVRAVRECYSLGELRDVYLGLLKAGLRVNRQSRILEHLSKTKNNVYALVNELRPQLSADHSQSTKTPAKSVWRVHLGRALEYLADLGLQPQLEPLYSLYRQDQLPLPEVTFSVDDRPNQFAYSIHLNGRMVASGEIRPDRLLATGQESVLAALPGEAAMVSVLSSLGWSARDLRERQALFAHYQPARWLETKDRLSYEALGCRVRDAHFDFGAQLVAAYAVFFGDVLNEDVVDLLMTQCSGAQNDNGWHHSRSFRKLLEMVYLRRIPIGNLREFIGLSHWLAPKKAQLSSDHLTIERHLLAQPAPPRPDGLQAVYFAKAVVGRLLTGLTRGGELGDRELGRRFQSKLRELLADCAGPTSGLLLHLPLALHSSVRNLVIDALSGWIWLAEAPKRPPRGALMVSRLSPPTRPNSTLQGPPPEVELELQPVTIELGRLWRTQQPVVWSIINNIEQYRLRSRLGLHLSSVVVRVNALLPVDAVTLSIGSQLVREWKAPPLSVEFLELLPISLVRDEPGVALPFSELYALTHDPGGQSDGVGWQTLMFWVLEDLLLGSFSKLLSHARMADLLRQAEWRWPRTVRKLCERWALPQLREVYLQLLSSGVGVAQHAEILHALADHQGPPHRALEVARMAIAPALVRQHMRGKHLHVITLNESSCEILRKELPEDPPALSFEGAARLQNMLLASCAEMPGHFVLLVPPDLRRPVECALEQWNVPVLSTAELLPGIALAHELTLDL